MQWHCPVVQTTPAACNGSQDGCSLQTPFKNATVLGSYRLMVYYIRLILISNPYKHTITPLNLIFPVT